MSQDHQHTNSSNNIGIAFFLNLFFAIAELIGGVWTNSLAVSSNGLHDLGDAISLSFAWIFDKLSKRERTRSFSYGYKRFSLVSAFLNSLILLAGSFIILSEAIPRLMHPQHSDAKGMFFFALIGLGINLVAYLRLRKGKTMNERVSALHLLDDVLGLSSVLLISIIIQVRDTHILDPILSILITLYLLTNVIKNLKKTISIFLQSVPDNVDMSDLENKIRAIPNVLKVHDTHVWSLDGDQNVLTTHVVVSDNTSHEDMVLIKNRVKKITVTHNIEHATVEIECENEKCDLNDC
ncbi:MAG: cation diffusion facilitator family transporter [Patescibacteria group bacterium]